MRETLRNYYQLTKPGVLYGNVLTGVAGFFLASAGHIDWLLLIAAIGGMTLVIAAACVINNYLDRDIDQLMERTKKRPSVAGSVQLRRILWFGIILAVLGFGVLSLWTNWLVTLIGAIGFITYVWLYGALSKRRSIHGTLVGSISGAMPIAGGYAAVAGVVDPGLIIVFLIMFFWQFPEFYSIAIYRRKEYAAAHVPVFPVVKGIKATIPQIFFYTILYVIATLLLPLWGYAGIIYTVVMAATGLYWIYLGYQGLSAPNPEAWARQMFKFSMWTLLLLCVMLSIEPLLP